jgi:hypothetical protein
VATSPGILRTVGSLIVWPCLPFFSVRWMLASWFRFFYYAYCKFVSSGLHVWILHLWAPLLPSLSPSSCRLWNSPLSHPLDACPPHAFAASCSSPLLPLTIVKTGQLCSEPYVLAFGVSLHKYEFYNVLFLSICFIV